MLHLQHYPPPPPPHLENAADRATKCSSSDYAPTLCVWEAWLWANINLVVSVIRCSVFCSRCQVCLKPSRQGVPSAYSVEIYSHWFPALSETNDCSCYCWRCYFCCQSAGAVVWAALLCSSVRGCLHEIWHPRPFELAAFAIHQQPKLASCAGGTRGISVNVQKLSSHTWTSA